MAENSKSMNTDLFPETLLVTIHNGVQMTDSRTVARYFEKQHGRILYGQLIKW
jgi:phage regulator Rha-like protein